MQCAVIEYARNMLGWEGAHSVEFDKSTNHPVIVEMPEHHPGEMGGTMRLGQRKTLFNGDSRISTWKESGTFYTLSVVIN